MFIVIYRYIHKDSPNRAMWWPLTTPIASTSSASTIGSLKAAGGMMWKCQVSGGAYTITYHNQTWGGIGSRYTNINSFICIYIYTHTPRIRHIHMYVYKIISFKSYSEPSMSGGYCSFQFWSNIQCRRWCIPGRARPPALHMFFLGWECEPRSYDHTRFVVLELLGKTGISPKNWGSPLWIPWIVKPTYWIMKSTRTSLNSHQYWIHTYVILCSHNNMNMNNYIWMNHVSNAIMRFVLNNVYINIINNIYIYIY